MMNCDHRYDRIKQSTMLGSRKKSVTKKKRAQKKSIMTQEENVRGMSYKHNQI